MSQLCNFFSRSLSFHSSFPQDVPARKFWLPRRWWRVDEFMWCDERAMHFSHSFHSRPVSRRRIAQCVDLIYSSRHARFITCWGFLLSFLKKKFYLVACASTASIPLDKVDDTWTRSKTGAGCRMIRRICHVPSNMSCRNRRRLLCWMQMHFVPELNFFRC